MAGYFDSNGNFISGTVPITGDADRDTAALTRAEFLRFQNTGLPAIQETLTQAENFLDPQYQGPEISQARTDAAETSALLSGVRQRNISRFGATLTPVQQRQLETSTDRNSVLSQINAVANTRRNLRNEGLASLTEINNIITGNYSAARGAVNQAGISAFQRESANKMASARNKAQLISGGIGLLGTIGFFALGGGV
jgi:hypothetical protein